MNIFLTQFPTGESDVIHKANVPDMMNVTERAITHSDSNNNNNINMLRRIRQVVFFVIIENLSSAIF